MKILLWCLWLGLMACSSPCEPQDVAILDSGWWYVTLADGTACIARPFQADVRDTTAKAIAECRAAVP